MANSYISLETARARFAESEKMLKRCKIKNPSATVLLREVRAPSVDYARSKGKSLAKWRKAQAERVERIAELNAWERKVEAARQALKIHKAK
jgi:hypothetical protein